MEWVGVGIWIGEVAMGQLDLDQMRGGVQNRMERGAGIPVPQAE